MGKSKRIRSDRARQAVASPEKFVKNDADKKAKLTTVILVAVIVALIVLTSVLVVLNKTGVLLRSSVVYRSDNYEVDGAMTTYMYYYTYNMYYSYYGQYASYFLNESTITTSAKNMLALCEGARAAGVTLDADEIAEIEDTIKEIKADAKEAGFSLSQLYGNVGVNASDIRKVLELQTLANKFRTEKQDELTGKYEVDLPGLEIYFGDKKTDLFKGGYLSVITAKEEWQKALKEAKSADEFKQIFIELYTNDNFKGKFNTESGTPSEKLLEAIIEAATLELKYTVLEELPEGVTVKEGDDTAARLKMFYQLNPVKDTTAVGLATISSDMYKTLASEVDKLAKTLKENIDSQTDKGAYIAEETAKTFDELYKQEDLPTVTLLNSVGDAVEDLIAYFLYGIEIEGFEVDSKYTKITAELLEAYYKVKFTTPVEVVEGETGVSKLTTALYTTFAAAADKLQTSIKAALTVKADYSYPTVDDYTDDSEEEDTTTEAEDDETTAEEDTTAGAAEAAEEPADTTTEAAQTTTSSSGTTTVDKTAPVDPEDLEVFDAWFFTEDRLADEIFIDEEANTIYYVTDAPKDKTVTKNVGHILIQFGEHTHEDGEEHSDEEYAEELKKAEEILAEFLATDKSKESFETIGEKYTDDSNVFYDNVVKGQMVEEFEDWIYDEKRVAGDTEIVKTTYGYHIMYFVGDGLETWQAETLNLRVSNEVSDWETELEETYKVSVNDSGLKKVFG